jgi:hypothetical protein
MLTPLPGSADHKELYLQGKWMEPDLNRYDTEHAAATHSRMSVEEWQAIYDRAWHLYYSPEHVATLLRRARAGGTLTRRLASAIFTYYGSYRFEHVHPLQSGVFRRKVRRTRRPGMPRENPLLFYSRRIWEIVTTYGKAATYYLWLNRLRKSIERPPDASTYTDAALTVPAGQAVNRDGSRVVTTIIDDDPLRATDPAAWWVAYKVNRARRNEDALALLNDETRRGRTKLATVEREAQEVVSCVQATVPEMADR